MNLFVKTPNLVSRLMDNFVWKYTDAVDRIYLTFDDGPIPEITPWVLAQLEKYEAKATFFCVGDNVRKHPRIFQQIGQAGHSIGNHTFNHLNGWKTNTANYLENVALADKLIRSPLFRPPHGKLRNAAKKQLLKQYNLIMWDVLSRDFDANISGAQCLQNVIENTSAGSIIVFHDSQKAWHHLSYVLPKVLEHFSQKSYTFEAIQVQQGQ